MESRVSSSMSPRSKGLIVTRAPMATAARALLHRGIPMLYILKPSVACEQVVQLKAVAWRSQDQSRRKELAILTGSRLTRWIWRTLLTRTVEVEVGSQVIERLSSRIGRCWFLIKGPTKRAKTISSVSRQRLRSRGLLRFLPDLFESSTNLRVLTLTPT